MYMCWITKKNSKESGKSSRPVKIYTQKKETKKKKTNQQQKTHQHGLAT